MMFANQIDKAYRSNIGQDLGGMQSMFMVTFQPLLIAKEPLSVI